MNEVATAKSLAAQIQISASRWPNKVSHIVPEGKSHRRVTFSEFEQLVYERAQALHALGAKRGDRVAIVGETSFDWALTDWACQMLGVASVPIYPTLPADQAQYIAQDCGAKFAVCSDSKQASKFQGITTYMWKQGDGEFYHAYAESSTLTREDVLRLVDEIQPSDLATLIYTSGTTGLPKGVMLTHSNFTFMNAHVTNSLPLNEHDLFLSWLPLAHVFERYAGHIVPVSLGATIAYAGGIATLMNDMVKLQPTVVLAVPRFLDTMRSRVLDNVQKQSPLKQKLFHLALAQGSAKNRGEFAPLAGILDPLVGAKIRERIGGKLRFFVSGGAALPPQTTDFFRALNIEVLQGYGLTETTAASSVNLPGNNRPWTVGPPIEGVEIKIAADGEILIRGGSVMAGYYNLPDATKEAIDAEGWFHTGDIGEFEGTHLKITDRKKDLLILGNGKNVAPQPVENKLKESAYIGEAMLIGDGLEHCCALIVPDFELIEGWLKAKGITESDPGKIVERDDVKELIRAEVDKVNKVVADYERVRRHVLVPKAFSVDDGELTPSLKLRKKVVKEKYADLIDSMVKK
jgi:long-chain acyl-CoA synthetase